MKQFIQATYLTGPQMGQVLSFDKNEVVFADGRKLQFSKDHNRYFLHITKDDPIFINNRELYGVVEVQNNDVIRLDNNTHNVLISLKESPTQLKTVYEIGRDASELAKSSKHNTFLIFFPFLFQQFFKYASWIFRIGIVIVLVLIVGAMINFSATIEQNTSKIAETQSQIRSTLTEFNPENVADLEKIYTSVGIIGISFTLMNQRGNAVTYDDLLSNCDYEDYDDFSSSQIFTYEKYGTGFVYEQGKLMSNKHVLSNDLESVTETMEDYYGCYLYDSDMTGMYFKLDDVNVAFPEVQKAFKIRNIKTHPKYDFAIADIVGNPAINPIAFETDNTKIKTGSAMINIGYPLGADVIILRSSINLDDYSDSYDSIVNNNSVPEQISILAKKGFVLPNISQGIIGVITPFILAFDSTNIGGNSGGPLIDTSGNVIGIATWKFSDYETLSSGLPINLVINEMKNLQ